MRLKLHPEARVDLKEGKAFYRHRSPLAAVAFAHEVDAAFSRIAEAPWRYPEGEHGTRELVLPWRLCRRNPAQGFASGRGHRVGNTPPCDTAMD